MLLRPLGVTLTELDAIVGPIGRGNEVHRKMVRESRNLFGVAALALLAIAATVGAMYVIHEGTSSWVAESRDISRLTRTAYVLTVEREIALLDETLPGIFSKRQRKNRDAGWVLSWTRWR